MGPVFFIKSLASVSQSVCLSSLGRNFHSIFMKFCTVVRGLKSKIEFVRGENAMTHVRMMSLFCPAFTP